MRRKIQTVHIQVGGTFYKMLEAQRQRLQRQTKFKKNITQTAFTEMLARSGKLKIPRINIDLLKNVRKKS